MAHIVHGTSSTVSVFLIDTLSLHSISDSVSATRAMSAVSEELGIIVQDTCEAAYNQHEVLAKQKLLAAGLGKSRQV